MVASGWRGAWQVRGTGARRHHPGTGRVHAATDTSTTRSWPPRSHGYITNSNTRMVTGPRPAHVRHARTRTATACVDANTQHTYCEHATARTCAHAHARTHTRRQHSERGWAGVPCEVGWACMGAKVMVVVACPPRQPACQARGRLCWFHRGSKAGARGEASENMFCQDTQQKTSPLSGRKLFPPYFSSEHHQTKSAVSENVARWFDAAARESWSGAVRIGTTWRVGEISWYW